MDPGFRSLALRDIEPPDYVDLVAVPLPAGAPTDPRRWAEAVFSPATAPRWVRLLFDLRALLVRFIGVPQGDHSKFDVCEVVGDEALISVDDRHLDFRAAIGVDTEQGLVRMTTAVKLHGLRGRIYFIPVQFAHPIVVRGMLDGAARALTKPAP